MVELNDLLTPSDGPRSAPSTVLCLSSAQQVYMSGQLGG